MSEPERKNMPRKGAGGRASARCRRPRVRADRPPRARPRAVGEAHRRHADPAQGQQAARLHGRRPSPHDRELRRAGVRPHHLLREMDPRRPQPHRRAGDRSRARRSRPGWPRCGPSTRRPAARPPRRRSRGEEREPSAQARAFAPGDRVRVADAAGRRPLPHALVSARQGGRGAPRSRAPSAIPSSSPITSRGCRRRCSTRCASSRASCGAAIAGPAGDHLEVDIYEHWLEPLK